MDDVECVVVGAGVIGLAIARRLANAGREVIVLEAEGEIGTVTSGTFSPTLKTGIALALLEPGASDDDVVTVDIRSRQEPFMITKPPFVTPGVRES